MHTQPFDDQHVSTNHQIGEQGISHAVPQHYKPCTLPYSTYHLPQLTASGHSNLTIQISWNTPFNSHSFFRARREPLEDGASIG
jgi:hypothetical protein